MNKKLFKNKKIISALLVVVAISIAITSYVSADKGKETTTLLREYTATVQDITVGIESSGKIDTVPNLQTFPENSVIEKIYVKVGSEVKKGDELAKISKEHLLELIESATNELSDANASLMQANGTRDVYLKQTQNNKDDIIDGSDMSYSIKIEALENEFKEIITNISDGQGKLVK